MMNSDKMLEAAIHGWAKHAKTIGLSPQGFEPGRPEFHNNSKPEILSIRMVGSEQNYCIEKYDPNDEILLAAQAQSIAFEALEDSSDACVQKVLLTDRSDGFIVHSDFNGQPCIKDLGSEKSACILNRMGHWCHDFHSATYHETRTFRPKFMVDYLSALAEKISSNQINISEPRMFVRCAAKLQNMSSSYRYRDSKTAQLHGQLLVSKFLFGSQSVCVRHFRPYDVKPIGYDISRLLVDFMLLYGDIADLRHGQVIPESIASPFFDSYKFRPQNDPSISFLMFTRLLEDWYAIQSKSSNRSVEQEKRLERILKIAEIAFEI